MMTTMNILGCWKVFLILAVLPCANSLDVSIPEPEYMVARGGDVALTCSFVPAQPDVSTVVIRWDVDPQNVNDPLVSVATFFTPDIINIAPGYEGRASLEVDLQARVSKLTLRSVTMQDSRRYQCSVLIPNDDEGTTAASTSLLVLVAPSTPICSIQGRAEYFHNISLTCLSNEGSPLPVYEWKSFSVENIPRVFPPKTTEKDGVLSLFNITRETSGFFACTSRNRVGSASCNFTLAVVPSSMAMGSTAAIIGGVLAGLVVVGIIVFCICRRRSKKEKYAEGTPGAVEFTDRDEEEEEQQWDNKSSSDTKQRKQLDEEEEETIPPKTYVETLARKFEDDQHSQSSGKERDGGTGSDIDSQRYRDNQREGYRGSRDRLDEKPSNRSGSRDRLDDERDRNRGSRDRLDDQRDTYRGSRDRLDDQRDTYRGSRDRLDDQHDTYRSSRDRLDDQRDTYRGSRDRLDDQRDTYRGSRDRLEDQRDTYRSSRDRLDYRDDDYKV